MFEMKYLILLCFSVSIAVSASEIQIVSEEAPPYNYTEKGKFKGVSTEVVKTLFSELKLPLPKIEVYPWARAYDIALQKENVLIYSITKIDEREKKFKWVGEIAPVKVFLYKLKSRKDIKVEKLDDAKKYTVGAARKDTKCQYLQRKGFKLNNSEIVTKDILNLFKLKADRIDLAPFEELRLAHICRNNPELNFSDFEKVIPLNELNIDVSIAFSLKTPDKTVEKFKEALKKIKENGTHKKILEKSLK